MPKNNKPYLIVDFDSTLVRREALEELGSIALKGRSDKEEILREIKKITKMGMEGEIGFSESLRSRLKVLPIRKEHIRELIKDLKDSITPSVAANKDFFKDNAERIFIISGGFVDFISPVAVGLGIKEENILANKFVFGVGGEVLGIEEDNLLSTDNGKVEQIRELGLTGEKWVIGDGWTDYEIKNQGEADKFIAFIENVSRDKVVEVADHTASSWDDILNLF
jgi:D-3-phosphoglycerate dehydrogenase